MWCFCMFVFLGYNANGVLLQELALDGFNKFLPESVKEWYCPSDDDYLQSILKEQQDAQMYSMTSCSWGNFQYYATLKRIESKQAAIDFSTSRVNAASSLLFTAQTIGCQRQMSPCLLLPNTVKMAASVEELLVFVFFLQVYWHKRYMYSKCLPDSYHLHTAVWRKLCVRRVTLQQSNFFFNLLFSFCIHIPSPLVCLFAWKAVYFCF